MSSDELFLEGYRLNVVEEDPAKAIATCRKALELDRTNYRAQVYLGMLLSDYGTVEERNEGRKHFVEAIAGITDAKKLCDNWFEESALHHLATWEWKQEHLLAASLFFLADVVTCHSKESYESLIQLLEILAPEMLPDLKLILSKISESAGNKSAPS